LAPLGSAFASPPEFFTAAERSGDPYPRYFFHWSTSAGNYIVRQDGMGEFTSHQGLRRVFFMKTGGKGKLERVFYLEHERDLFLLYEVRHHGFYLARMEQTKRKLKWLTALGDLSGEDPSLDGDVIRIGKSVEVSKADGRVLTEP
jgi:hypothetical protein